MNHIPYSVRFVEKEKLKVMLTMYEPPPQRVELQVSRCKRTLTSLGILDEARASSIDGLVQNHLYADCRGCTILDVHDAVKQEQEILQKLAAADWTTAEADEVLDTDFFECFELSAFDVGMGAAVVALSAAGFTPISSCNGGTIGSDEHSMKVPNILFAAGQNSNSRVVWEVIENADLGLVGNGEFAEMYADQVLKFHSFAEGVIKLLEAE